MTTVLLALTAGVGVHLLVTTGRTHLRPVPPGGDRATRGHRRTSVAEWLVQSGLDDVDPRQFAAVVLAVVLAGGGAGCVLFGGPLPALAIGLFAGSVPVESARRRRDARRARARDAWPRLIEEIRLFAGPAGRSVPQALFDAGERGPLEMRSAFAAARREWLLSTDFARTLAVLRHRLADATADTVCETLLVAHEVGGADLDARLEALAEDRIQDQQDRKDARSRLAGARFARWFTLVVPLGMALAGLSIGTGRSAYQTPAGQILVVVAVATTVGCWLWAGALMRLPSERRVLGP